MDANFALLAWRMVKLWGQTTAVPADFMPLWGSASSGPAQSDEAMMRAIEGVFRKT